ncbi:uncharacterized protein F4822DRAFT_433847 [Hypoxylon trugodes]|uniref:uncharacterized protein n=1 Tax=Hypoxylon trugodes TaxID=326681 RepID=UPI00218D0775|nr:uncharacterized protein F4822DRAFT_433847 [Hypoxylon trugodes]KAI1383899.1 hypothetical protein F4822DRAFT_433847 [Hypoxylon trugodes]
MFHPEQVSKTRPTPFEVTRTNNSYDREALVVARYPSCERSVLPMEYPIGVPRDRSVAWTSHDRALSHSAHSDSSRGDYWSSFSEPLVRHSASSEHGGVSRKRGQDPIDGSPTHQSSLICRNQRPSRVRAEQSHDLYQAPQETRRRYKDVVPYFEDMALDKIPRGQSPPMSKQRRSSWDPYDDPNATSLSLVHGRVRHKRDHSNQILSDVKESYDWVGPRSGQDRKQHAAIPPKAPKIPRLPTPDFDFDDYDEKSPVIHQFCACCDANDSFGAGSDRRECSIAKMERQVHEAKSYISRKDPRSR